MKNLYPQVILSKLNLSFQERNLDKDIVLRTNIDREKGWLYYVYSEKDGKLIIGKFYSKKVKK